MDAHHMIHRNLKLEKLLLDSHYSLKVAVSGMAKKIVGGVTSTFCGSPQYLAPEVCLHQPYTSKADIWAAGVSLYVLLMRQYPFTDPFSTFTALPQAAAVVAGLPWADLEGRAGPGPRRLLEGMLRVDPTQRLTIQQVVQDPWVQSVPEPGQPGYEELVAESRRVMAAREARRSHHLLLRERRQAPDVYR
eukprot:GAFH01003975.1.p1 GENE.GAFH01003975.1~~GAFH01003975.1.p1  ORF type:complete len:190 (-),score=5.69 GAFH01003975.1:40-609(-)